MARTSCTQREPVLRVPVPSDERCVWRLRVYVTWTVSSPIFRDVVAIGGGEAIKKPPRDCRPLSDSLAARLAWRGSPYSSLALCRPPLTAFLLAASCASESP